MIYSRQSPPQEYYIYAYIRSQDSSIAPKGTPYYIGKGSGKRAWVKHKINLPEDTNHIVILESNLTEIGAYALERRLIRWYGRIIDNDGILENISKGGPAGRSYKSKANRKGKKNKNPYPLKGKSYDEIFGTGYSEIKKRKLLEYAKSENGKERNRKAGLKAGERIKENGWSREIIEKRVKTRQKQGTYYTDMSACYMPEAIEKRTKTRLEKGVNYNTIVCNSAENRFKRQRTKLLELIRKLELQYKTNFSQELLRKARKERVSYLQDKTLFRYLTLEELSKFGYTSEL